MWIKLDCDLDSDLKLRKFATICGVTDNEAIGALVRLWSWARKHAEDGYLGDLSESDLCYVSETGGKPVQKALMESGLLNEGWISGWDEYGGCQLAEKIKKNPGKYDLKYADFISHYAFQHPSAIERSNPLRGDKRREEKKREEKNYTAGFEDLWQSIPASEWTKGSKKQAYKEYIQCKDKDSLTRAASKQLEFHSKKKEAGEFVPHFKHLCRWIKDERYKDEIPEAPKPNKVSLHG